MMARSKLTEDELTDVLPDRLPDPHVASSYVIPKITEHHAADDTTG
jgi:hypothetical protein